MTYSIGAVERATGVGKDTLRAWEQRYKFPQPLRDAGGERIYTLEQVNKLRLLKQLLDQGHRPGKIVHFSIEELHRIQEGAAALAPKAPVAVERPDLQQYMSLLVQNDVDELRSALYLRLLRNGLESFIFDVVIPMNIMVGACWVRGEVTIDGEHLYTEVIHGILRRTIFDISPLFKKNQIRPRILLTTLPNEKHGIGLLMAEALYALEGAHCISLGVQTPIADIVRAGEMQRTDIVTLSISACIATADVLNQVNDLLEQLPYSTEIWIGGAGSTLLQKTVRKIQILNLPEIPLALAEWRANRPITTS